MYTEGKQKVCKYRVTGNGSKYGREKIVVTTQ
jgi:hypothetical protein